VDGVMIGRAAVDDPYLFAAADAEVFGADGVPRREGIARAMIPGLEALRSRGEPLHRMTRHALELFAGQPGTRAWKRTLTEAPPDAEPAALIEAALGSVAQAQAWVSGRRSEWEVG
jgi:tRNA-dihydrouridine synthase A